MDNDTHECSQNPTFTSTGLQIPYGWSEEGLETFSILLQEIETDRINHGTEFDKDFREAMEKEVEDEKNIQKKEKNRYYGIQ